MSIDKLIPRNADEIETLMNEFKTLRNENNYNRIREKFFELFGIFPLSVMFNKTNSLKYLPLFRACPADKVLSRGKSNLESYMGPPQFKEVGNGRANWNGRNVFYAGDSPYVTVVENKKVEIGQEYYVGKWEIDVDKIIEYEIPISYLTLNNLSGNNPWNSIMPSKYKMIDRLVSDFNVDKNKAELFSDFISELSSLFSDDNGGYNLSAFIADNILYSENSKNFIPKLLIYPSIETNKNRCNIAINPEFAQKYLTLKKVVKIKIVELLEDGFKANYSAIGQVEMDKVKFYHFNFDRSKAVYKIESFKCGCGSSFRLKDPEKMLLVENNVNKTLRELVEREYPKWLNEDDLLSYNQGIFESNGIALKKILKLTLPLPNISILRGNKTHTSLFCEIIIEQPFDYIKEDDLRYNLQLKKAQFIIHDRLRNSNT